MQKSKPAAEGESAKGCVEVSKDLLRQGGQGVAIQGQQGEGGDPSEGTAWQGPQQIEPKVQNLQHFKVGYSFRRNSIEGCIKQNIQRQYDAKMRCMSQKSAG